MVKSLGRCLLGLIRYRTSFAAFKALYCRRTWPSTVRAVVLASAMALGTVCPADSVATVKKKIVGVTLLSLQFPFVATVGDAMKVEAAKEGIELLCLDSARNVMTELSQVQNLISRKVDLIIMYPVDQKTSQTAANLINQAGIPLILLNTKFSKDFQSGGGNFVTYVGADDIVAGEIEGHYLADQLPDGGNVIYLAIEYGRSATEERKAGFQSVIKDHPNLAIVSENQGYASRAKAKTIMENLLRKYGNGQLQAVVAENDEMAIGASSAIQAADRLGEFKVLIGINGLKPALEAVTAGTLTATVFQDAVAQGTQIVVAAGRILAGETVERQYVFPFKLVTKENVASFK
jgi:ABC-type sugar transport system substrate-binding protein